MQNDIQVTAYSPLGRPGALEDSSIEVNLLEEETVKKIAQTYNKTTAQILLNWGIKRNTVVIPKSTNTQRITENMDVFDFEITGEEKETIDNLNKNSRIVNPLAWWGIPYFS